MSDLRQRVPGQSLVDELLRQWDRGTIHIDAQSDSVVIDEEAVGWYRGVIGERRVAELLGRLDSSWTVLHSVPVGAGTSDIDHVVIGPAGVFTINTKYSPGKKVWVAGYGLHVDGFKTHYVRNSVTEAARASDLLSRTTGMTVPVVGVIVFVNSGPMTRKAPAAGGIGTPDISVVTDAELLVQFASRPIFSDEQVQRIVEQAIRPETWHTSPVPSSNGQHAILEFAALEEAVGPRLAQPVVRAPKPSATRPPTRRPARKRKPRRSSLDKLLTGLAGPIAAFVVAIWMLNYFTQK